MLSSLIVGSFNFPKKYTKTCLRNDQIEVFVHKSWLKNLIRRRRVPGFIYHEKLSNEEVNAFLHQGETLGSQWYRAVFTVVLKKDKLVLPLSRVRIPLKEDVKLSLAQVLEYVSKANLKNLWKQAQNKYHYSCWEAGSSKGTSIQFTEYNELIREILIRMYKLPVIKLGDSKVIKESNIQPHPNLLPAIALIETDNCFVIIQDLNGREFTVHDCVSFSPAKLSETLSAPLFIIYQLIHLMRHLEDIGLALPDITLSDITITDHLWIQVKVPELKELVVEKVDDCRNMENEFFALDHQHSLAELCSAWVHGALSNYDYLCALNKLAGRTIGHPNRHYVMPWVSDLTSRSGANWRDLTKSKFRLNKGDAQLDLTYQIESQSNQVAHHIPEVLSEITYYVYLARVTPRPVLCRHVRSQWVPAEYPFSIQRLHQWTPDEAIPEFYSKPSVFKSMHADLGDLEVPSWANSAEDFVSTHRSMLESPAVSARLHHWIDLTFGYKLSGVPAVRAKNVCLHLVDGHKQLSHGGVVQLFSTPHPHRMPPVPPTGPFPSTIRETGRSDDENSPAEEEDTIGSSSSIPLRLQAESLLSETHDKKMHVPREVSLVHGAVNSLELLHNFQHSLLEKPLCCADLPSQLALYKQLVSRRRTNHLQVIACLICEIFLATELRVFGIGVEKIPFSKRFEICKKVATRSMGSLPKCVQPVIKLLLRETTGERLDSGATAGVLSGGLPQLSPHLLLQPLLSPLSFPHLFPTLHSTLVSVQQILAFNASNQATDITSALSFNEMKIKSLVVNFESISDEGGPCLQLLVPYFKEMLSNPSTDVIAAWYLFDYIARGLGPRQCAEQLLESLVHLLDRERAAQAHPRVLHKRVKLYHRSFLLRLIVRLGLRPFLDAFAVPLVEAVGGYHDLSPPTHLFLSDGDESTDQGISSLLSPLDDDSSADLDLQNDSTTPVPDQAYPEIFVLEEDSSEESIKKGPKSAKSLQNLLIDNIDEKECVAGEGKVEVEQNWTLPASTSTPNPHQRFPPSLPPFHHSDQDLGHTKFVCEVCEVGSESVCWLAARLGPVLTASYISRNLLRMLALCYIGPENLTFLDSDRLVGDTNAAPVINCLTSIAELYGEQFVVVQYLAHATELITYSKKKLSPNIEGGLVGSVALLSAVLDTISDSTLALILQEVILRRVVHPLVRVMSCVSSSLPSGVTGRRALATKLLQTLSALVTRAPPPQRISLLHTLHRFFSAFSKARNLLPYDTTKQDEERESGEEVRDQSAAFCEDAASLDSSSSCLNSASVIRPTNTAIEELYEVLTPEFAYKSYLPFANFFGENLMEQSVRNHLLMKQLCQEYLQRLNPIPGGSDLIQLPELPELSQGSSQGSAAGSFGNVILIGNRIDLQEPPTKSCSPAKIDDSPQVKRTDDNNRHLRGNWAAYWEHEIGRNSKSLKLDIKQIKLQVFSGHTGSVRHIVPLSSENSFMSGSRDKTVRLWALRSQGEGGTVCGPQWTYTGHRKSVLGVALSERCRLAVSTDSAVHVWDPWVGRPLAVLDSAPRPVNTLAVLPPPSPLALCPATDGSIRALDLRTCSFVNELKVSGRDGSCVVRCLCVSPLSYWLAAGQSSGSITVLDLRTGAVISHWKAHDSEILQLIAIDEYTLISSSLDQLVCVWNVADGKHKFILKGPSEPVHCLEMYEEELVSGTTSNRIGVHSPIEAESVYTSGRLRTETLRGVLTSMSILPLNRLLLLGADSGIITLIC